MHPTSPALWLPTIDRAITAMETIADAITASGFGDTPFSAQMSDATEDIESGAAAFSARKPDLATAHQALRWETVWAEMCRTLQSEVVPLLAKLRGSLPVLTGPAGSVRIGRMPSRPRAPAQIYVSMNGIPIKTLDAREGILAFVHHAADLGPTTNTPFAVDGTALSIYAASPEEAETFWRAIQSPPG